MKRRQVVKMVVPQPLKFAEDLKAKEADRHTVVADVDVGGRRSTDVDGLLGFDDTADIRQPRGFCQNSPELHNQADIELQEKTV